MADAREPHQGKPLGVSLQGLLALVDAHGGRLAFAGLSTGAVKRLVLVVTGHTRTSYAEQLLAAGSPHVAPATAFISHAYDDEFLGVLDSVAALEATENTVPAFYYFDLLVINQHGQSAVVPFEVLRGEFGRSVQAIGRTLLVLRWANPIPLQRAWCVFEMATTLAVGASMKVLMPPVDVAAFREALLKNFDSLTYKTCRVDVEKAGAREQTDLDNIKRVITETGGFLKTNQLVIEAMKSWMVDEGRASLTTANGLIEKAFLTNNLASLLRAQGLFCEAEALYREALVTMRRTLGDEHPSTLCAICGLSNLLKAQGKLDEAKPHFLEVLAARRRVLGNRHPDTLASINCFASLMKALGRLDEAELLYNEALVARRCTLGNEHPDTLASINGMANLLKAQGKFCEAEPLFLEALAARRRIMGNEHPDTLTSINGMANLLKSQGKLCEAEPLYLEALASRRRTLGNVHPDTLGTINGLAILLKDLGKLRESEPLYLEALDARRQTLGKEHTDTLHSIHNYAGLLLKQGRIEEALKQLYLELEGTRRVLGEDHPSTIKLLLNYERLVANKQSS